MNISLNHIRITGHNKYYWLKQLEFFANLFDGSEITRIEFGKQDTRGGISISFFGVNGCIIKQHHCESKDIMLGYISGVNDSQTDNLFISDYLSK